MQDTIILIPARMGSTRLKDKPLADIGGRPMIVHVMEGAVKANAGDVCVAVGEEEIAEAVTKAGGRAVLTDPALPSGTDRVYAGLKALPNNEQYKYIVNIQGDLPLITPIVVKEVVDLLKSGSCDMSTAVSLVDSEEEFMNPNVVKAVLSFYSPSAARALYFSRSPVPNGAKRSYHHLGIYGYTRSALEKFVSLPPSELEVSERLEQLRAMEAGLRIDAALVKDKPFGVDTAEDLAKVRTIMGL